MDSVTVEITWLRKAESSLVVPGEGFRPSDIKNKVSNLCGISPDQFFLVHNGRLLQSYNHLQGNCTVKAIPKLLGGKGGFGSMLRAIGAQIEKTTNREACRDLSGRRLRDINEEKRLKNWIAQQAERERQEAERKQKRLEKLRALPKHEFSDKQYDEERSQLEDKVHDAIEHGFQNLLPSVSPEPSTLAGPSTSGKPSTSTVTKATKRKPMKKGFMFEDEELSLSEEELEPRISGESVSNKRPLESVEDIETSPSKKKKIEEEATEGPSSSKEVAAL